MDYKFNDEQKLVQETVRQFANERLDPVTEKMDAEDYFPMDLFKELGELGLLGPTIPMEYEGAESDYITQGIILEELARVSPAGIRGVRRARVHAHLPRRPLPGGVGSAGHVRLPG